MPTPFAKCVDLGGKASNMRESDKRKFKERLKQAHPALGSDQLEALVGTKATPLSTSKLLPRDEIISRGQDPLFFTHTPSAPDHKGASELIPTVLQRPSYRFCACYT
jgi:hypothetical protein